MSLSTFIYRGLSHFQKKVEYPTLVVEYPTLVVEYPTLVVEYPTLVAWAI